MTSCSNGPNALKNSARLSSHMPRKVLRSTGAMCLVLMELRLPGCPSRSNENQRDEKSKPLSHADAMLDSSSVASSEMRGSKVGQVRHDQCWTLHSLSWRISCALFDKCWCFAVGVVPLSTSQSKNPSAPLDETLFLRQRKTVAVLLFRVEWTLQAQCVCMSSKDVEQ